MASPIRVFGADLADLADLGLPLLKQNISRRCYIRHGRYE
jgi:hypothetical protein